MTRHTLAVILILGTGAADAVAQGIVTPYRPPVPAPSIIVPQFPIVPGVTLPIGPGIFLGTPLPWGPVVPLGNQILPVVNSIPGFYPLNPWGTLPFSNPGVVPAPSVRVSPEIPSIAPSRQPDWLALARQPVPAELTIVLPNAGSIVLDGEPDSAEKVKERRLSSSPLARGTKHTFRVTMRWENEGVTYAAERTVEVEAGEPSKLVIFAGTPVK